MLYIGLSQFFWRTNYGSECVHLPKLNFTDALFKEDCYSFQLALVQSFTRTWEEIEKSPHCHHLSEIADRGKLAKDYLRLTKKEIDQIKNINTIYQIALDEKDKFRAYGIKRKFREADYFEILLFDPNHLFYLNKIKGKYPFRAEAACLMDCLGKESERECSEIN